MTAPTAAPTPPTRSAVQQFDQLVEGIGGYGGQCATPPHVLAPTTEFSDQLTAMRKRIAGLEFAIGFLAGGPLEPSDSLAELDDIVSAIVAMGGHRHGISHLLRQVLATDRAAARRYRALRRYLQVGPTEDDESWGLWCISRHQPDDLKVAALVLHFPDELEEQAIASGKADWGPDVDAMVDSLEAPRETRTEGSFEAREVSGEPGRTLTDGSPITPNHRDIDPLTGQQKAYVVLSAEERAKGFARPVRDRYVHLPCGTTTTMGRALAETYARQPDFYSGTFCCGCRKHFPVGADGEFVWAGTDVKVGT